MNEFSYDIRFWKMRSRKWKSGTSYQVRWLVAGRLFSQSFNSSALADSFRSSLVTAARAGEAFDTQSGLPVSQLRRIERQSWYGFACSYVDMRWPELAPMSRKSLAESMVSITIAMLATEPSLPDGRALRRALKAAFKPVRPRASLDEETQRVLKMVDRASGEVGDLADPEVLRKVLRALETNLNGKTAAPDTARIRRVALHSALDFAVERKLLKENPLASVKAKKRKGSGSQVDPACVINPDQAHRLLEAVRNVGKPGPPLVAFFGLMYYAGLRPEEARYIRKRDIVLPAPEWDPSAGEWADQKGQIRLVGAWPDGGADWTDPGDNGQRSLKHRNDGSSRVVPCPPVLSTLLREHLDKFGAASDGRLFRASRTGGPVTARTYGRVWAQARRDALDAEVAAGPLAKRPYDLRHAAVSTWLNGGVGATRVAEWAGHSVAVLLKTYAKCIDGGEEEDLAKVEQALRAG